MYRHLLNQGRLPALDPHRACWPGLHLVLERLRALLAALLGDTPILCPVVVEIRLHG